MRRTPGNHRGLALMLALLELFFVAQRRKKRLPAATRAPKKIPEQNAPG